MRRDGGEPLVLVVTASGDERRWVLPKGHVEPGEAAADTAIREVREEAGVVAERAEFLTSATQPKGSRRVTVEYFLLAWQADATPREPRQVAWLPLDEAIDRLTYPEVKAVLRDAGPKIRDGT